jgi:putative ATP-dependent endonuclease of OLD family
MDVMPDCAPVMIEKMKPGETYPALGTGTKRQWRAKQDFTGTELTDRRKALETKTDGQSVKTFVSDEWTLEYDLAFAGLGQDVLTAIHLADNDDDIVSSPPEKYEEEVLAAKAQYEALVASGLAQDVLATTIYAPLTKSKPSKAITAQYLARRLVERVASGELVADALRSALPSYLVAAIEYVTQPFPTAPVATPGTVPNA